MRSLKEIKEYCEKVAEGPWVFDGDSNHIYCPKIPARTRWSVCQIRFGSGADLENARFIANARTDLPRLAEWAERARKVLSFYYDAETQSPVDIEIKELLKELGE